MTWAGNRVFPFRAQGGSGGGGGGGCAVVVLLGGGGGGGVFTCSLFSGLVTEDVGLGVK